MLIFEEKGPELLILASLLDGHNLVWSLFVLLENLDVLPCLCHVWSEVAVGHVASLPDVDWVV